MGVTFIIVTTILSTCIFHCFLYGVDKSRHRAVFSHKEPLKKARIIRAEEERKIENPFMKYMK